MTETRRRWAALVASAALVAAILGAAFVVTTAGPACATAGPVCPGGHPTEKVTLCHAAGLAGTTQYRTITVGWMAAFGPAGHFFENGTPRAGHEQDYLGKCRPPTTSTTAPEPPPTTSTTAPEPPPTTSTTAPEPPPTTDLPFTGRNSALELAGAVALIAAGYLSVRIAARR